MKTRHLIRQAPVVGALLRTVARAATRTAPSGPPTLPGPELNATVSPRPRGLVDDFVRWAGGSPSAWRGQLPPTFFPQWGFPLLTRTLLDVPYDLVKVVNAGCRLEIRGPLPDREPLQLRASLQDIDDDGRRAILQQRLVTGTASAPDALVATLFVHVPTGKGGNKSGKRREKPRVPEGAREIGRRRLRPDAGWQFALLTGDFNPVHWIGPYARAAGFRGTILHGFGTLAIAVEALNKTVFSGDPSRLRSVEVRFTRPLVLPREVRVLVDDEGGLYVGDRAGGPAYLVGAYTHA